MANDSNHERQLRDGIAQLKARYDEHFPPVIYAQLKQMESDLAWSRHQRGAKEQA